MRVGAELIRAVLEAGDLQPCLDAGLTRENLSAFDSGLSAVFPGEDKQAYKWVLDHHAKHDEVPSLELFRKNFPEDVLPFDNTGDSLSALVEEAGRVSKQAIMHAGLNDAVDLYEENTYKAEERIHELSERLKSDPRSGDLPEDWLPRDLFEAASNKVLPTIGQRNDGINLIYPGCTHFLYGETESGKSWLALHICSQEIRLDHHVAYVDFEDSEAGIGERIYELTQDDDAVEDYFHYIRPESPVDGKLFARSIAGYSLVIFDGVTEAMGIWGLNIIDNSDYTKLNVSLAKPCADQGTAVIWVDHVVKKKENQDRYPIGGVHKINSVSGASYKLINKQPFGECLRGTSQVIVTKDRKGSVRGNSEDGIIAELVVESQDSKHAPEVSLEAPGSEVEWRPTQIMANASRIVHNAGPMSRAELKRRMGGNSAKATEAIQKLLDEGYFIAEGKGSASKVRSVSLFHPPYAA